MTLLKNLRNNLLLCGHFGLESNISEYHRLILRISYSGINIEYAAGAISFTLY